MKRIPSVKALARVFSDPARARHILEMSHAELAATNAGAARIAECFHAPAWYDVRMTVLAAIEPCVWDVEGFQCDDGSWVTYINAGDAYVETLIYWRGRYTVGCWADIAERHAQRDAQ